VKPRDSANYRVRIVVPVELRPILGCTQLSQSVGTKDKKLAQKRSHAVVADLLRRIAEARPEPQNASGSRWFANLKRPLAGDRGVLTQVREGIETARPAAIPAAGVVPFNVLVDAWMLGVQRPFRTVEGYIASLDKFAAFLGHDDAARVVHKDAQAYQESLERRGLSGNTVRACMSHLNTLFEAGKRRDKITANPIDGCRVVVKKSRSCSKRQEGFTMEELSVMLQASRTALPLIRIFTLMDMYSGARPGEIIDANKADFVEREGHLVFHIREDNREEGQTIKTAESKRRFPLHSAICEEVRNYLATLPEGSPLFPFVAIREKTGKRVENACDSMNDWIQQTVGFTGKTCYYFRHTAKRVFRNFVDREDVADYITGHASPSVSRKYGKVALYKLAQAMESVPADPMAWEIDD